MDSELIIELDSQGQLLRWNQNWSAEFIVDSARGGSAFLDYCCRSEQSRAMETLAEFWQSSVFARANLGLHDQNTSDLSNFFQILARAH